MATKKEVIRLKNVTKHYYLGENVVRALDGIDVLINQGGFVSIMGSSGSGKSTMVNLIGSLDTPTNGKIFLDKMDVSKLSESALAQLRGKKIGFIFTGIDHLVNYKKQFDYLLFNKCEINYIFIMKSITQFCKNVLRDVPITICNKYISKYL